MLGLGIRLVRLGGIAKVNLIRNPRALGSVAGTPGTAPTNWTIPSAPAGLARSIVGTGEASGLPYIDIRYSGTLSSSSGNAPILYDTTTGIPVLAGVTYTSSVSVALVAGSVTGVTALQLNFLSYQADATTQVDSTSATSILGSLTATLQRFTQTVTTGVGVAFAVPRLRFAFGTSGTAVDFSIRVAAPQFERGSSASSPDI
ncbi:hypothetical protein NON00_02315 [Roseomonas sp. GC11]|uniref:hypothetical protein n=1 Tax=Roseomonas sp. GC11 TaxID=2950546 RepID=UPI002108AEF9|nr:hypothetical protein [Roseomonas sp. GC11]MCQ4158761.1 hypothetical protein [Roseomonas sp. GC11]